jgi:hypothetical protein
MLLEAEKTEKVNGAQILNATFQFKLAVINVLRSKLLSLLSELSSIDLFI